MIHILHTSNELIRRNVDLKDAFLVSRVILSQTAEIFQVHKCYKQQISQIQVVESSADSHLMRFWPNLTDFRSLDSKCIEQRTIPQVELDIDTAAVSVDSTPTHQQVLKHYNITCER